MTLQEMAVTVLMCRDERRGEFLQRLADKCFGGDVRREEMATVRLAAGA